MLAMPLRNDLADAGLKFMNATHRAILKASGGRALSSAFGMPAVRLAVTGRKSGLRRETMLTAPILDDQKVVLVASKGGDDRDPEWFRNLVANPEVEVTIIRTGETRHLKARVASAEEKAELWPTIVAAYRGYAGYQKRTDRQIPVVICEAVNPS
jgi:deazaflavin-dependent oxidoreductase (nitroreductase family)